MTPIHPDGLSTAEARRLLAVLGPNAMPDDDASLWRMAIGKFWAPVPWMLELAVVLQLALGEYVQGAVIAVLLVFNGMLGLLQESRAQATLDALKKRLALTASVRRDGTWQTVGAAELVPGDVAKLSLGHVVAADMRLIEGDVLLDQSMLTGESLPIEGSVGQQTYAGALVRRGEAVAVVTATGVRTKFGRTAELVRNARVPSSQQQAVLRVVRNLAVFNAGIVVLQAAYASWIGMSVTEIVPLLLTAILAAIPVALPATFTLASAITARALAQQGVLPTRLSAVDEAATMDVLCADKTGTLTRNELAVSDVRPVGDCDTARVLALAALASSEGGQDPVDMAIRTAADGRAATSLKLTRFVPFDPALKMSEAEAQDSDGARWRIVKGACVVVFRMAEADPRDAAAADALAAQGNRVLAVAAGPEGAIRLAGLIALSDPPRPESAALISQLRAMGVRTVMLTGDAPTTAATVAAAVGIDRSSVSAGTLPEDKYRIVQQWQQQGHTVGMCGDGANDAPALRQAQIGIAVSTATDVAKSAAGIVLTEPGLGGIVAAVHAGRVTFQRILTYLLRSMTRKLDQMLFLTIGLVMTGHAVLTPMLMVVLMTTGDFLAMSASTDNVRPSPRPNAWRIDNVTLAGSVLASCNLAFCSSVLAIGTFWLRLGTGSLQTLAAVTLVFSGQAVMYTVRERERIWSSRPSTWLMASSVIDVSIIAGLATFGILMTALPMPLVLTVLAAAVIFAFLLDSVKAAVFARLKMV
ncbi:MAG TPA: HAD-IC family P-type ATPase [Acetobacteraceae bacterium]